MRRLLHLLAILLCTALVLPVTAEQRGRRGITVFEDANLRGRSASFSAGVRSLRQAGMNDMISSFVIAGGESWELCEDDDFRGRCEVFSGQESNLGRSGMNDRISSMRPVGGGGGGVGNQRGGRLELFEDTRFRGRSVGLEEPARSLGRLDGRAESLRLSGTWQICDQQDFRGRCTTVSRDISNLDDIGWKERIRSARPR